MAVRTPFTDARTDDAREFDGKTPVVWAKQVRQLERDRDRWKKTAGKLARHLDNVPRGLLFGDAVKLTEKCKKLTK